MEYQGQHHVFESGPRLGGGGFADVFRGHAKNDASIEVAIKIPRAALDESVRELFLREAVAAKQVASPHVVRVVDWGEAPPFIAFELISGQTLSALLEARLLEHGYLPEATLVGLFSQLVEGLCAINRHVIHRDLKPANIFVDGDLLKISDFGSSKYVGEQTRTKTFKGAGTPAYMAPETFQCESVDWRADQYSLGVVFFEMATLRRPFSGTPEELERLHIYQRPARITSLVDSLSERLATAVAKMLEKRPDQRFQSWPDLHTELHSIAHGLEEARNELAPAKIVRKLAEQLEAERGEALVRSMREKNASREEARRVRLLSFWREEFAGRLRSRVDALNRSLGEEAIKFSGDAARGETRRNTATCSLSFLSARLSLEFSVLPLSSPPEFLLWGSGSLRSNRRQWGANFLLNEEPAPYGSWLKIDMQMHAWIRDPFRGPRDRGPGAFECLVGDPVVVLAKNPEGLFFQRDLRNTMSEVNYSEEPLEFDSMLEELLSVLVEDAREASPAKVPTPIRRRSPYDGMS